MSRRPDRPAAQTPGRQAVPQAAGIRRELDTKFEDIYAPPSRKVRLEPFASLSGHPSADLGPPRGTVRACQRPVYQCAGPYAALGNKVKALGWLERARENHESPLVWIKIDPRFDSLRNEPRFKAILREMKLGSSSTSVQSP